MKAGPRSGRIRIGSVLVDPVTEAEVAGRVRLGWRAGVGGSIVTVNVDILRAASRDPACAGLVAAADLVVVDGMPLVWAARAAGTPVPERVTGASLVFTLSAAAAAEGRRVFLLGGEPGVPQRAGEVLAARHRGLRIAGASSPPFGFDRTPEGRRRVLDDVTAAAPDLVLVGLGFPKQERTIELLRAELPGAWYLGCGAGIPMAAGAVPRAPAAAQRLGLEWVHRLAVEPRRLARRYLRDDLPFAAGLLGGAILSRVRLRGR